jgi:DNA replication protein DnaC
VDPDIWDRLLASPHQRESTRNSPRQELRLSETPVVAHLPKVERSIDKIHPALLRTLQAVCTGQSDWPLFIFGPVGTGKTCAAVWLLDHARGLYYTVGELAESLIESMAGRLTWQGAPGYAGTLWPKGLWERIADARLFVLDELGSRERVSDHQYDTLKRVLDKRHGRPLICISNLDLDAIEQVYDDRIASRLAAGTVFHLDGNDRRLFKRLAVPEDKIA